MLVILLWEISILLSGLVLHPSQLQKRPGGPKQILAVTDWTAESAATDYVMFQEVWEVGEERSDVRGGDV